MDKEQFKLTKEQYDIYLWLKAQEINTDENTLSYWSRTYTEQRLKEVVIFAKTRREAGQQIRNIGGWIHKLLKDSLAVPNDETKINLEHTKEFCKKNKWINLKIYEKYIKDGITGDDLPLTMEPVSYEIALETLYNKSQLYENL